MKEKKKKKCHPGGDWKSRALDMIKTFEGVVYYPYLDTKGLITIGIGFNIDPQEKFMAINFLYTADKDHPERTATREEKLIAYRKLKGIFDAHKTLERNPSNEKDEYRINFKHTYFEGETDLLITDQEINMMTNEKMDDFEKSLKAKFPEFECFPAPARVALMDLIWSIGATRLERYDKNEKKLWPGLIDAVQKRDWIAAAKESSRKGVNPDRNSETRLLFLEADSIEKKGEKDI